MKKVLLRILPEPITNLTGSDPLFSYSVWARTWSGSIRDVRNSVYSGMEGNR